ncbi:MAG: M56 family metallopeptidase [Terracidiphilus sp.]
MNSIGSFIVSYAINAVWEIALIAAAGWLVCRLIGRVSQRAEHVLWVAALFVAVLTPAVPALRPLLPLPGAPNAMIGHISISFTEAENSARNPGGAYALSATFAWPLLAFYCGSLLYFALRLAGSLHGSAMLLRGASPLVLTAEQEEIWQDCRRSFSLDELHLLESPQIPGPVVMWLRKPVMMLPTGFAAKCSPADFLAAVAHECAHIKRHDFGKNLAYEALSLVVGFHPATWALKSQIAQTREIVCDGMVTEKLVEARSYAHSLLRLATMVAVFARSAHVHAIGIFDANILERRIMRMKFKRQSASAVARYSLMVPAMLFLVSVALGSAAMAVVVETPLPAAGANVANTNGQIYKIGKDVTAPIPLNGPEAEFPKGGRKIKANFSGIVLVGLTVDAEGMPRRVHVVRSLRPDFDAEAIKAVNQYRFKPAMRMGRPVAVGRTIEVNFKKY